MDSYCKRLIEVDLPIRRISAHARREKSIRHGHISTLHIWWARRPLAACRAVGSASLWPDPADVLCPDAFRQASRKYMSRWAKDYLSLLSADSYSKFMAIAKDESRLDDMVELRQALLHFIADFADWNNSTKKEFVETSRALTQVAHEALGGLPDTRPLVLDPFAGGGSIPLEISRLGGEVIASDLNPIAVLLNKVILDYQIDADTIELFLNRAKFIGEKVKNLLADQYPSFESTAPFVFLWARTLLCEGPKCGVEIPFLRGMDISKRSGHQITIARDSKGMAEIESVTNQQSIKRICLQIKVDRATKNENPTCKGGSVTCPRCNFTMKQSQVAAQACAHGFGHRLIALGMNENGRKIYRSPTIQEENQYRFEQVSGDSPLLHCLSAKINPNRPSPAARGMSAITRYGYRTFCDMFSSRQIRLLGALQEETKRLVDIQDEKYSIAVHCLLAIAIDRLASFMNLFCRWAPKGEHPVPPFGKNGFPMIWDYAEANPFTGATGSWDSAVDWVRRVVEHIVASELSSGSVMDTAAQKQFLPDDCVDFLFTDPPYYDSYPYADLSDFFYPFLRTMFGKEDTELGKIFSGDLSPKCEELVVQPSRTINGRQKDENFYQAGITEALHVARAVVSPSGIGVIVFANKETVGWEALLASILAANWVITASWPIQTERESRSRDQARLQSSVHLVCRPREDEDGAVRSDTVGDWRDILSDLPERIHEWMPRLAEEGIVGADAIFACLGPALEIFSRYSSVEKANGEKVELKEYLEEVWAAVSREALSMIFEDADASGFEEDARLTAMWLWTLRTAASGDGEKEEGSDKTVPLAGYGLEFDAARKIAQGLGANLDNLSHLVAVKGDTATLLSAAARTRYLFGKDAPDTSKSTRKKKDGQLAFNFEAELQQIEQESADLTGKLAGRPGLTVLDQLHQSMLLFASGRGEAMRRFLIEEGAGNNPLFWRLAQAFSALYPSATEEKRWVDGVLARKKSLGF